MCRVYVTLDFKLVVDVLALLLVLMEMPLQLKVPLHAFKDLCIHGFPFTYDSKGSRLPLCIRHVVSLSNSCNFYLPQKTFQHVSEHADFY